MKIIFNKEKAEILKKEIWKSYLENKDEKDYLGLYIDIPFCRSACLYCYHNMGGKQVRNCVLDDQVNYLEKQFQQAAEIFGTEPIYTINFGGGSPSLLSPKQLEKVFKLIEKYWNLQISDKNEMGFEFHPAYLTNEHIKVLENSFINRLSMGVQTFDKEILRKEHRAHVSEKKIEEIFNKVKAFSKQTNVDLLSGLIGQTPDILEKDVKTLLDIGVDWLTIYKASKYFKHWKHPEIQKDGQWRLLQRVYEKYNNYPGYYYIGSESKKNMMKCNRFYRLPQHIFEYSYNPAPIEYNNILGFSIDESEGIQFPWSYFIPINKGYEKFSKYLTLFYSISGNIDKSHWRDVYKKREHV